MITNELARQFGQVDAFDSCAAMISDAPPHRNVFYDVVDADEWVPTGTYDVAFMSEILEHLRDPDWFLQRCSQCCDFLIASAPIDEPLAGTKAFDVEARKEATRETRGDGAGHLWAWDWTGFVGMFAQWPVMFQGMVGQHGIVMAHCVEGAAMREMGGRDHA
jgi:hypothetical protein